MNVGSLGDMIKDFESGVTNFTKNGECSNCGACCSEVLPLTEAEVRTIHKYVRKYGIKPEKFNPPTVGPVVSMVCPFRNEKERKCNIYPVRPEICRDFRCDKWVKHESCSRELLVESRSPVFMGAEFFGDYSLPNTLMGEMLAWRNGK